MDEKKAQEFLEEFNAGLHRLGRITLIVSVILLVGAPFIIGAVNGVMPDLRGFLSGFAKVGIIYIPVGIVEFLVYTPMLGAGGSYLAECGAGDLGRNPSDPAHRGASGGKL